MLNYNELTSGTCVVLEGDPYIVLASHVFRKQQRKPVNQTKLRNLITGKVTERSFHQSEMIQEANIQEESFTFIYSRNSESWFNKEGAPKQRISLPDDVIGDQKQFLKEGMAVSAMIFDEKIIGIKLPIKVELSVTEAPPSIKGDTAQGGTKQVTLETGAVVAAPLFVNTGDVIRINTTTGEYTERVEKG